MKLTVVLSLMLFAGCLVERGAKLVDCSLLYRYSVSYEDSTRVGSYTNYIAMDCYPSFIPDLKTMDLKVYSWDSKIVFQSQDTANKWLCGGKCPKELVAGTYFTILEYTTKSDSNSQVIKDNLTLIIER